MFAISLLINMLLFNTLSIEEEVIVNFDYHITYEHNYISSTIWILCIFKMILCVYYIYYYFKIEYKLSCLMVK